MKVLARKRLLAGVICGVVAAVLVFLYVSDVRAQAMSVREDAIEEYGGETAEVCVASHDIAAGQTLSESDVSMKTWVVDLLPEGAATDASNVVGETASVPIYANEPILTSKLGDPGSMMSVPDGLCAVTVPSEDVNAVGGAIRSGSLVNVYASDSSSVRLLGENILVLETSNSTSSSENSQAVFGDVSNRSSISWVTLAVTPESVEELISASRKDDLYLVLPGSSAGSENSAEEGE
ncbi:MAG: Flp pilus assembly protein CpaB [Coriobacteriales bacterium]|jgi:pilus assembly protein CpaB